MTSADRSSRAWTVLSLCLATIAPMAAGAQYAAARPATQAASRTTAAPAKHMLFRVRGKGGPTIYLLGSVHLLSADAATLPPEVDSAFAHAKSIAFETSLDSVSMRAQEIMARGRFAPGTTLHTSLSAAGLAKLDTVLPAYGLTVAQVDGFKPWIVSLIMGQMVMQRANFQPQYGVDAQLNERAHAVGKPIVELEAVDFQLGLFDALSPADQERMLIDARPPVEEAKELAQIKDAWIAGNTAALDSLLNSRMSEDPSLLATLVTNRSRNWIPKIEAMLHGSDDVLVVVGAGHLVGKQGVLELLRAKGYTVEQL